ncbi:hypothetical protein [Shimazuella kribbensis]|uniref:hypothetical protein n=1 Tax=Shimazuella kribbensis TaxID=139808 RepID=UPI000490F77A|nr:hypothetical protein [Shimazuella kribbensis]
MKQIIGIVVLSAALLTACNNAQPENPSHSNHNQKQSENHSNHNQKEGPEHSNHAGNHDEQGAKVTYTFKEGKAQANQNATVQIKLQDQAGKPIEKLDISHEKKLHLIAVSKDLSYFSHIHPEMVGKGQFEIQTKFPAGGEYKLFSDFVPTGGSSTTKSDWIKVEGKPAPTVPIQPESKLTKAVDGKEITLAIDKLQAGKETMLNFNIKDEKSKNPITDLEQYLGAVGHVVILDKDAKEYLHVHPMEEKAKGPDAKFMTTFPKSGIYKIWGQFKHKNEVITVPFVVNVP